jgi:predicted nucleic acid-binding protein
MSIPIVVPDASVLLKWVLPSEDEPYADDALQLRSAIVDSTVYTLVRPLWIYEVGNTIARRFPDHAQAWLSLPDEVCPRRAPASKPWLTKTLELVQLRDVTLCDAPYHALAIVNGGIFVTADPRYATKTASSGSVVLVGDWRPPPAPVRRPSSAKLSHYG